MRKIRELGAQEKMKKKWKRAARLRNTWWMCSSRWCRRTLHFFRLQQADIAFLPPSAGGHCISSAFSRRTLHFFRLQQANITFLPPSAGEHYISSAFNRRTLHFFRLQQANIAFLPPSAGEHCISSAFSRRENVHRTFFIL